MPSDSLDSINAAYDVFPSMVIITVGLVLTLVSFSFRSVLLGLRCIITITLTLLFVYGFANLTFVDNLLSFMQFEGLLVSECFSGLLAHVSKPIFVHTQVPSNNHLVRMHSRALDRYSGWLP